MKITKQNCNEYHIRFGNILPGDIYKLPGYKDLYMKITFYNTTDSDKSIRFGTINLNSNMVFPITNNPIVIPIKAVIQMEDTHE